MSHGNPATTDSDATFDLVTLDDQQDQRRTREYLADQSELARNYYAQVPFEEASRHAPDALGRAALSHWNFAAQRPDGTSLIRIFEPRDDQHGWTLDRSVIEIVTADRPFLVRSVALAIGAAGLNIQQFIHPIFHIVRDANGAIEQDADSGQSSRAEW